MPDLDPRLNAYRPEVADAALEGRAKYLEEREAESAGEEKSDGTEGKSNSTEGKESAA